jgi:DNA replication protein DnaC
MENVFYFLNLILRKFNLLLQGPPGTGKSFLGVKILRLMLSMKINERFKGPILVGK